MTEYILRKICIMHIENKNINVYKNVGSVHFIVDTLERGFDAPVPEFTEINIFILWILNTMRFIFSKFFLRISM